MAKRQKKKFLQPRFWGLICVLLIIGFSVALAVQYVRLRSQEATLANLESEQRRLMEEVDELSQTAEYMQTDEYIEQAARDILRTDTPEVERDGRRLQLCAHDARGAGARRFSRD